LGIQDIGALKLGNKADFVLLDDNMRIKGCWINGKQVSGNSLL
jgi:N-acetylglucosamine-6-phosphate deacetylase